MYIYMCMYIYIYEQYVIYIYEQYVRYTVCMHILYIKACLKIGPMNIALLDPFDILAVVSP